MRRIIRTTATLAIGLGALLSLPTAAFAGSKARTTCTESFAEWHQAMAQPAGGYVTIDFGLDGVDYTTTVWQQPKLIGLGARFEGATYRIYWHTADGTVVATKGKGVAVVIEPCATTTTTVGDTTTTAAPPITEPATTTAAPPTADPTTSTTVLADSNRPTTTVASDSNGPVPSTTRPAGPSPSDVLPETGPVAASSATMLAVVAICLGMTMLTLARRRPRATVPVD